MTEISSLEFIKLLNSNLTNKLENYSIQGDFEVTVENIADFNHVLNCHFDGHLNIRGYNRNEAKEIEPSIIFDNCIFENNVVISRCNFSSLTFSKSKIGGSLLSISECIIDSFEIITSDIYSQQFSIAHSTFITKFHLSGVNSANSNFSLRDNKMPIKEDAFYRTCFIADSILINCDISKNDFGSDLRFTNNHLGWKEQFSNNYFKNCIFRKATFYKTDFGASTTFKECRFDEPIFFEDLQNEISTNLEFAHCTFKSSASFKKSRIHYLNFKVCIFESSSFFQNTYFDIIKIDTSIFEKAAFFDDVQIKKIYDCDRRTIRSIKYNLQKTDNKIDYNRFRIYELEAYKKDLRRQISNYKSDKNHFYHRVRELKNFKRDLFILNIFSLFSDYGTDWKRALKWTLLIGVIFYSLFFINVNWHLEKDITNWEPFTVGLIRFFILTDFYNPLGEGRTYIENDSWHHLLSWFIFIFGKILIAFGIYEMVQAFRKFKA